MQPAWNGFHLAVCGLRFAQHSFIYHGQLQHWIGCLPWVEGDNSVQHLAKGDNSHTCILIWLLIWLLYQGMEHLHILALFHFVIPSFICMKDQKNVAHTSDETVMIFVNHPNKPLTLISVLKIFFVDMYHVYHNSGCFKWNLFQQTINCALKIEVVV